MNRLWVLGSVAAASVWVTMTACGGSGGGTGNAATGGGHTSLTVSSSSSSSSSSTSGGTGGTTTTSTVSDPVCNGTATSISMGCQTCINGLGNTTPCIQSFLSACQADTNCNAYLGCQNACAEKAAGMTLQGVGGGGTACVAGEANGDAGSAEANCLACCQANMMGADTFFSDLLGECACTVGAPCVTACSM
jgi:hypothetical protein